MKRFLALKASAGTGKTYALATRYLALLFLGARPLDIVAVTFTNKAANEMRERVRDFLMDFDGKRAQEVGEILGMEPEGVMKLYPDIKRKYLSTPLNITTIDSFIQSILRKFVYYASLRRDFEIVDEMDIFETFIDSLNGEEFGEFVKLALYFDYSTTSLKEFFDILYHKSKELEHITIPKRRKPDEKEAKEAFERLKNYILNSEKASKVAKNSVDIDFYHIPKTTWFKKDALKKYSYFKKKDLYQDWFEDVLQKLKEYFKSYLLYQESDVLEKIFGYFKRFEERRIKAIHSTNTLSFEDVKHFTYDLLQKSLDSDYLYFRLDSQIEHILIDEFQDTSLVEWKVFEPLVEEMRSTQNRRSFFFVGDTKQAIYGFKGGMAQLFDYVAKKFGMEVGNLDVNYRSKSNIVDYVNRVYGLSQKSNEGGGYVDVSQADDIFEKLKEKIDFLKENGVNYKDMAILVHTNKEVERVARFLEEELKIKAKTSSSKMVVHHPYAYAITELLRYLHNPDITLHLYNFQSVAKEYRGDIAIDRPLKMIKDIASKYGLWDESVLALMQKSMEFVDLLDFVENIDSFTKELKSTDQSIEVLTIHKSKGLAFKNVILLDRLGSSNNKNPKIIFDYDGIKLKRVLLRNGRERLDSDYEAVLQKERKKEEVEYRNLIYVALTRAKEALIVLKGKNLGFLDDIQTGEIIPGADKKSERLQKVEREIVALGRQELEVESEEEYSPNDYEAIYLGNAYHSSLELSPQWAKSRYGIFDIDFEKIERDVKEVEKILNESFKGERYKEIAFKNGEKVGIIDLLIKDGEDFVIVDYKSVKPKDISSYIKQVQFYKNFVKGSKGFLLFIDTKELKEV